MAGDAAGEKSGTPKSSCPTATEITALRQAVKDCYCGLGQDCTHWEEMTNEERADCSRDKRAAVEYLWKNGLAV
jgi:hypothetical protein